MPLDISLFLGKFVAILTSFCNKALQVILTGVSEAPLVVRRLSLTLINTAMNAKPALSFIEKEKLCEHLFSCNGPYWHLCTDGNDSHMIFSNSDDMKVGMNLMGICARIYPDVSILTFELMNNHLHIILSGRESKCREMFTTFRSKLQRFFMRNGRSVDLSCFECQLIAITDVSMLRNEIAYTNRNGFLTNKEHTPFSYPWGAGAIFFNPWIRSIPATPYASLSVKAKRAICKTHDLDFNGEGLMITDGMILPSSYCRISLAESMFRDAHNYFFLISRNFESYNEIAKRLHETIFLTDEELYAAISSLCRKTYDAKYPAMLSPKDKIDVARKMHFEYNASNRQIKNILRLETHVIDTLFPSSS